MYKRNNFNNSQKKKEISLYLQYKKIASINNSSKIIKQMSFMIVLSHRILMKNLREILWSSILVTRYFV